MEKVGESTLDCELVLMIHSRRSSFLTCSIGSIVRYGDSVPRPFKGSRARSFSRRVDFT